MTSISAPRGSLFEKCRTSGSGFVGEDKWNGSPLADGIAVAPTYAVASVDNALRLVQLLQRDGMTRVTAAAAELGVAPSTAHRLLAMLCYRGFAIKNEEHMYALGATMKCDAPLPQAGPTDLVSTPFLERLREETGETVHLVRLVGNKVEFLHGIEGKDRLRVGLRTGAIMDADRTAAGRAILASLSSAELGALYGRTAPPGYGDVNEFHRMLAIARTRRYAINDGLTERGITAVGAAVRQPAGTAAVGISVSAPAFRMPKPRIAAVAGTLLSTIGQIEAGYGASTT